MSIHKDNATGKWRVVYRYTDWTGETHQSSKRGFPTKREAQMWERELLLKKEAKLDMTFESFYEIYVEDMQNRIRDNTWGMKTNIARTKILPYFGKRKIGEIEPRDIIAWQNELLAIRQPNGKPYSASYLQKIHSQLRSSVRENQRTCHNRSARVDRYSNRVGTNPAGGNAAKRIITKIKCQSGTIDSGIWNPV